MGLICLQETRVPYSGSRVLDNGYILITAGEDDENRTYAGAGFFVAPRMKRSLYNFKPISERICCLKLRVKGGKAAIVNAYAPHNGYPFQVRQQYFSQLSEVVANSSSFGLKLVVGDLNARIHNNIGGDRGYSDNIALETRGTLLNSIQILTESYLSNIAWLGGCV